MDSSFKALIMGASVLLFVMGLSYAIISYSKTMQIVDTILTTSEKNDRTAENFEMYELNTTRTISSSEVILSIIDMKKANNITFKSISVNGRVFTANSEFDEKDLASFMANDEYVIVNQDYDARTIEYVSF